MIDFKINIGEYTLNIKGEVTIDITKRGDEITPPVVDPEKPSIRLLDWNALINANQVIKLDDGITYLVPDYQMVNLSKDLTIECDGKCKIIFGKNNYNQWKDTGESKFIFDLGVWNNKITIRNVDLFTQNDLLEVQPFYRTLFRNSTTKGQTGTIELINSKTNMEYGLLYSGSQNEYLTCKAENVDFEGVMFQELKANNGGGLLSYQRNCNLKQLDPITHFSSKIKFINNTTFETSVPMWKVENMFIENGNSCNILYVDGKTFYLPKTNQLDNVKTIRRIPSVGEQIQIESFTSGGINYLRTKDYELQVGDIISYNGSDCVLKVKDRSAYSNFNAQSGYWVDFKPELQNLPLGTINVVVKKSTGLDLVGKEFDGYLIFKYNKNWQTNTDIDHGLDYMLASNPFGVLSYNHEEITVDWENVVHDGYYRQSQSGIGTSNGYRVVNCVGYGNEFNPPVIVITQ